MSRGRKTDETTLIDRTSRTNLAESLRHLAAGVISNDAFERRLVRHSHDAAVRQVFSEGAWNLYSDLREYCLTGSDRLSDTARTEVARWILFLKTNLPYEWPVIPAWVRLALVPLNLITFGLVGRLIVKWLGRFGDQRVWPFLRRSDYEAALNQQPYLNPRSNTRLHPSEAD